MLCDPTARIATRNKHRPSTYTYASSSSNHGGKKSKPVVTEVRPPASSFPFSSFSVSVQSSTASSSSSFQQPSSSITHTLMPITKNEHLPAPSPTLLKPLPPPPPPSSLPLPPSLVARPDQLSIQSQPSTQSKQQSKFPVSAPSSSGIMDAIRSVSRKDLPLGNANTSVTNQTTAAFAAAAANYKQNISSRSSGYVTSNSTYYSSADVSLHVKKRKAEVEGSTTSSSNIPVINRAVGTTNNTASTVSTATTGTAIPASVGYPMTSRKPAHNYSSSAAVTPTIGTPTVKATTLPGLANKPKDQVSASRKDKDKGDQQQQQQASSSTTSKLKGASKSK